MKVKPPRQPAKVTRKPTWPKTIHGAEVPLYSGHIFYIQSKADWEAACAYLGRDPGLGAAISSIGCSWHLVNDETGESIFLLGTFDGTPRTFVHECGHITMEICEHVGIDPRDGGQEAFTYLLDWVFAQGEKRLQPPQEPKKEEPDEPTEQPTPAGTASPEPDAVDGRPNESPVAVQAKRYVPRNGSWRLKS